MVDSNKVLVIVKLFISKIVITLVYQKIILKYPYDLLKNNNFFRNIGHIKNLVDILLIIENPTIQSEEDNNIHI